MTVAHENKGGPAFPGEDQNNYYWGMSLRDWFAGQALSAFTAPLENGETIADRARAAYRWADAMLAERAKE